MPRKPKPTDPEDWLDLPNTEPLKHHVQKKARSTRHKHLVHDCPDAAPQVLQVRRKAHIPVPGAHKAANAGG